jgi:hypothetical protein
MKSPSFLFIVTTVKYTSSEDEKLFGFDFTKGRENGLTMSTKKDRTADTQAVQTKRNKARWDRSYLLKILNVKLLYS